MLHIIKLKPDVRFGIHTGTMEHQISHRDANNIKMFLGLKINDNMTKKTDLSSYGISEISIEEAQYSYTDKNTGKRMLRKKIRCCVRVNLFVAKYKYTKLQDQNGQCCMSKKDKVASLTPE